MPDYCYPQHIHKKNLPVASKRFRNKIILTLQYFLDFATLRIPFF